MQAAAAGVTGCRCRQAALRAERGTGEQGAAAAGADPQRATASGIWHSQHKLCAVSIFGLLSSKKRTVTDERHLVANNRRRRLSSCAAARLGAERSGMGLHHAAAGFAFYPPRWICRAMAAAAGLGRCRWRRWRSGCWSRPLHRRCGWAEPGRAGGQPVAIMRPERVQALVMVASSPVSRLVTTGPASSPRCWPDFSSS